MFDKFTDIETMRHLISRTPQFGFLSFDKGLITRVVGGGTSKKYFYPRSCFLEKKADSAIFWCGKGQKVEVPYHSGVICYDGLVQDETEAVGDLELWWAKCSFIGSNATGMRMIRSIIDEHGLWRPMAISGISDGGKFIARKIAFGSEADATLFTMAVLK